MATKATKKPAPQAGPAPTLTAADLKEWYEMLRATHCLVRTSFGIIAARAGDIGEEAAKALSDDFDRVLGRIRTEATSLAHAVKDLEKRQDAC